ncbi:uncharacterized protein [Chamaea fasciata]|uniref:uncharacterized protein n=1 Tax=Chamaea fasciata TaxID=190680 RepID=UPI00336A2D63
MESEPGSLMVTDQFCKDKQKVQEAEKPISAFKADLKLGVHEVSEKRKHKEPDKNCGQMASHSRKSYGQVAKDPWEAHLPTKHSWLKPLVLPKEAVPRNTVGIKRPGEPLEHNEPKRVRKVESEPGPLQVTAQFCKDQLKVKAGKPKATESKGLKLAPHEPSGTRKDKGSHQANAKGFVDPKLLGHAQQRDTLIPSGHRPGDPHKEKVPLPPGEKKWFLPARKADLKRKAVRSPEESPGKKKREDKGDTPRKKKE